MERILKKQELYQAIEGLLKDFEVIGPQELSGKGIFYQSITESKDLYLGNGFTVEPVKKFFLEPAEYLFKENFQQGNEVLEEISALKKKRIILGVRPCEARGLTLLDKVFNSDYQDKSYLNNREKSILVGLACASPDKSCFCTSLDGSPIDGRGMDALLFALDDSFVIEAYTDQGRAIFGSLGKELTEAEQKSLADYKQKTKDLIEKKIKAPRDLTPAFESTYWAKVSFSCLSCGICTYLCPTCHCFDLVDEERKRLRCYDGCAFSDFTLEASGVNPRPTKKERYRQRVFHKFDYFKKNFGENLCVGCGRCIRFCPVKMDIAEIVDKAPI